ncbi:tetratricopeptide repeat protein [Ottowia thiooxydans]|uniref:tetratricopeptide repeat protein n=1 Tax=Ottowia thiooxydans TaxID=219182 RepID=UPI0012EC70DF|nr:tetratricopeptide repeat protein [Ottowia thiooxydans]
MRKTTCEVSKNTHDQALKEAASSNPNKELVQSLIEKAHQDGDRRASYALATWYLHGHGEYPANIKLATKLLKSATEADVADAHFDLAVSYELGYGIRKNYRAAYRHYLAAALNGDKESHAAVGRCLYLGIGVDRDRKIAEIWFRRADALRVTDR